MHIPIQDQAIITTKLHLRLPNELLLSIAQLSLVTPHPNDATPQTTAEHLKTLSLVCPLFHQFAQKHLLATPVLSTQAQGDALVRTLRAEPQKKALVRELTVARAEEGKSGVTESGSGKLLECLTGRDGALERVKVNHLAEEEELSVLSSLLLNIKRALLAPLSPPHSAPPVLIFPCLVSLDLSSLPLLPLHAALLSHSALPALRHLSVPYFTPSTLPHLHTLTPQLTHISFTHLDSSLRFPSVEVCYYRGSLSREKYAVPPSTRVLLLAAEPNAGAMPYLAEELERLGELKEVRMRGMDEVKGGQVKAVCERRGVRLVEVEGAEDVERVWERLRGAEGVER